MAQIKAAYLERELTRGMRPDAYRFIRPDWRRCVAPNSDLGAVLKRFEQKYRPDQPRVPAGSREGGQWTGDGGASDATSSKVDTNADRGRISTKIAYDCDFMHRQDLFICKAFKSAACYAQAY
jgi:hypothetical protein